MACRRVGEAVILWHGDRDLQGVDAVVVPGGFSYGDYLRVGAIARFAPVMEEVAEFAAAGGLVLGICNGFQVLCEAGLLPGALLPNTSLRFIFRQVELEVVTADSPFTRACEPGQRLSIPVKHTTGPLLRARRSARAPGGGRSGAAALRARARTPTARSTTSPASATSSATCSGSCPIPSTRSIRSPGRPAGWPSSSRSAPTSPTAPRWSSDRRPALT